MWYVITMFLGLLLGASCMFLILLTWIERTKARAKTADFRHHRANELMSAATDKELAAHQRHLQLDEFIRQQTAELNRRMEEREREVERLAQTRLADAQRLFDDAQAQHAALQARVISYREMQEENAILKRDLQNMSVNVNKLSLDGEARDERQAEIVTRSAELAGRYLSETVKSVVAAVGPNNFSACKSRLLDVIAKVREIGFDVPPEEEARLVKALTVEFEKEVRAEFDRQEQARIKAQIREEERLKREIERELQQLAREKLAVQAALDQAMAEARGQFSAEVENLKARLAEAEAKSIRTLSMAEQTKAGHVYVISNIGTLGDGIYKIGMTRRLNPQERVIELSDASVPFPFDVHMMIHCDNAPSLENALHRHFHKQRVNRANPRKEFFRAGIEEIHRIVLEHHGEVQYVAAPEASEYRQSLSMSEADAELIEQVYEAVEGEKGSVVED